MSRDQRRSKPLRLFLGIALLVAWLSPRAVLTAQARIGGGSANCRPTNSIAPDEALQLAVGLKTFEANSLFQYGTGIIIGDRGGTLYVATAAHVVLDANKPVDLILAYFYSQCSQSVTAKICSHIDPKRGLDLAILCIPTATAAGARPHSFSRLGSVRKLNARTPVYPVGCPGGECWGVGQPDKVLVAGANQPGILFTSYFVAAGHSGGPLFNEWWEVVGMLTKLGQPLSEAIPIDSVLNAGCDAGCRSRTEMLHRPFLPRGGYRLSLGVSGLYAAAAGQPSSRFPPGRANLMYRVDPLVELHAGSIRLAPDNLSVTGAMAGLGVNVPPKGPVWGNLFLEGGFAHVEGRFDAGGHYIGANGSNTYVPLWQQLKDDGLGYGAGISLMALVAPHTIVEFTAGHWSFNSPANAPRLPDIVWGAGLRLGI